MSPVIRRWLRPNRIVPLLTIAGAGTALTLSLIGVIKFSTSEQIVIALVGLLAIDGLNERLILLEGISERLDKLYARQSLLRRNDLPPMETTVERATEICIAAISGYSLITTYLGFFERKIREGCNIKIIILDPSSSSVLAWNQQNQISNAEPEIKASLSLLTHLVTLKLPRGQKGRCEVRLLDTFLPFSLFGFDVNKKTGIIVTEFHVYRKPIDERPNVMLTQGDTPYWFSFYRDQFEKAWNDSKPWNHNS